MTLAVGISVIALLLSAWAFYRTQLMGARVRVSVGDSIDIVRHSYSAGSPDSIQVACTFSNEGGQTGVIEKLALVLRPEGAPPILFNWSIFFAYQDGHASVPREKVHSIPVLARQTRFEGVQFSIPGRVDWSPGRYVLELLGWVNRNCEDEPNLRHSMAIKVSEQLVKDLTPDQAGVPLKPSLHTVMLEGLEITDWPKGVERVAISGPIPPKKDVADAALLALVNTKPTERQRGSSSATEGQDAIQADSGSRDTERDA
jgi:hypothetical protein